ncbi:MAG: hypothetical protein P8Z00_15245 [Anaerolineales bacterium]
MIEWWYPYLQSGLARFQNSLHPFDDLADIEDFRDEAADRLESDVQLGFGSATQ